MPLFDYRCPLCDHQEFNTLVSKHDETVVCPVCHVPMTKLMAAASFKIKGFRAANGYGMKFIDTYGKSPVNGTETGCSFTSNRGATLDHNQRRV
jgi:putative FmdB family regulatory protein